MNDLGVKINIDYKQVTLIKNVLPNDLYLSLRQRFASLEGFQTHGKFLWYDYRNIPPRNVVEEIITYLSSYVDPEGNLEGVEWWMRIRPADELKPLHFDKDEKLFARESKLAFPAMGSVFYFGENGGATLVLDQSADPETREHRPQVPTHGAMSSPDHNQYLLFPGNLRHGVLSASDDNINDDVRMTLLINWWNKKPLEENFPMNWEDIPEDNLFRKTLEYSLWKDEQRGHEPNISLLEFEELED
ncbi:MAG: hypothetical protein R8G66_05765 [Cytophagales bacterium]|nr:hypothetical protein [Cytophagales bacterium]